MSGEETLTITDTSEKTVASGSRPWCSRMVRCACMICTSVRWPYESSLWKGGLPGASITTLAFSFGGDFLSVRMVGTLVHVPSAVGNCAADPTSLKMTLKIVDLPADCPPTTAIFGGRTTIPCALSCAEIERMFASESSCVELSDEAGGGGGGGGTPPGRPSPYCGVPGVVPGWALARCPKDTSLAATTSSPFAHFFELIGSVGTLGLTTTGSGGHCLPKSGLGSPATLSPSPASGMSFSLIDT
mmetsp:Transcript_57676/g.114503  ORF Transcript_57676/g.114503 Transcript_57676/m.114503 type:complete len:244 (-) Transcript_57676:99-830(-)